MCFCELARWSWICCLGGLFQGTKFTGMFLTWDTLPCARLRDGVVSIPRDFVVADGILGAGKLMFLKAP